MKQKTPPVTPIKYVGSKLRHDRFIRPIWEKFSNTHKFVELFAGSMALSFLFEPKLGAVGNDFNWQLINFWNYLKESGGQFKLEMSNESEAYYNNRSRYNSLVLNKELKVSDFNELAELFYYLNRHGFNGLYRVNKSGEFNVSFANYDHANGLQDLSLWSNKIKNWEFFAGDFENFIFDDNDFIFADPPYFDVEFKSYTNNGFSFEDHERLVKFLAKRKNPIIITNQDSPEMRNLYYNYGYEIKEISRPKNFRGKNTKESKMEIMATRNI